MQGSPLQDRTRQCGSVHESSGQNRIFRAAHCRTEQDNGGQCLRVQDRTGHARQHIAGQNTTLEDSAGEYRTEQDMQGSSLQDRTGQWRTVHGSAGQNRTCRADHCRTEQDNGGQCMRHISRLSQLKLTKDSYRIIRTRSGLRSLARAVFRQLSGLSRLKSGLQRWHLKPLTSKNLNSSEQGKRLAKRKLYCII
jgi:hypothetical protein